jgi:hypothetical protein
MTKLKKIISISLAAAIVLIVILVILIIKKTSGPLPGGQFSEPTVVAPKFLDDAAKEKLGIAPETKIQSLKENEKGEVMVYKVINNDSDIVLSPAQIGSISPRQTPAK